jgi:hypothetical protein
MALNRMNAPASTAHEPLATHVHHMLQCSCGTIITQCRCRLPEKPVRILAKICTACHIAARKTHL